MQDTTKTHRAQHSVRLRGNGVLRWRVSLSSDSLDVSMYERTRRAAATGDMRDARDRSHECINIAGEAEPGRYREKKTGRQNEPLEDEALCRLRIARTPPRPSDHSTRGITVGYVLHPRRLSDQLPVHF